MAIGLYKPAQGYWVRVMTAAMLAAFTFATAAWVWGQVEAFASTLPKTRYALNVTDVPASAQAAGTEVRLIGEGATAGEFLHVADAVVDRYDPGNNRLHVRGVKQVQEEWDATTATHVEAGADGRFEVDVDRASGAPSVEPLFLQGGGAAIALLLGAICTYWFAGASPKTVDFLIATDMEMKKVNWSTRRDIINSTLVVILVSVLMAASLFLFDYLFTVLAQTAGILAR